MKTKPNFDFAKKNLQTGYRIKQSEKYAKFQDDQTALLHSTDS